MSIVPLPLTVEGEISPEGQVFLHSMVRVEQSRRVIVTILDELPRASLDFYPVTDYPSSASPAFAEIKDADHSTSPTTHAGSRASDGGRYRTVRTLASGGMGTAFEAEDSHTGQRVCIKRLHSAMPSRFLEQERKSLFRLSHDNIVRFLDYTIDQDTPSLVMQYIDGPTLAEHLRVNPRPETGFILSVARSLFSAVCYAHGLDIIHRDLKPDNVLLATNESGDYTPKIVDFGLALVDQADADGADTGIGRPAGTVVYMAPEQFSGERLCGKCDVYALGVIVWEMCAGRQAFAARNWFEVADLKRQGPLCLLTKERPDIPPAIGQLIVRCTSPDRAARPSPQEALSVLTAPPTKQHWTRRLLGG